MSKLRIDATGLTIRILGKAIAILLSNKPNSFNLPSKIAKVDEIHLENLELLEAGEIPESIGRLFSSQSTEGLGESKVAHFVVMDTLSHARDNVQENVFRRIHYGPMAVKGIVQFSPEDVVGLSERHDEFINSAVDDGPAKGGIDNEEYDSMISRMALANMFSKMAKSNADDFAHANNDRELKHVAAEKSRDKLKDDLTKKIDDAIRNLGKI